MPTSAARLGYENLLENGTVVASSQNPSFPVQNVFDGLTCDFFKPAATGTINIDLTLTVADGVDYFAFYGHDLHTKGGTIKLQYWTGSAYADCFAAITPTDSSPRMVIFTARNTTRYRVVITCTGIFSIASISFGEHLALEYGMYLGWTPPILGRNAQLINSVSDGGAFLGRSLVAKGVRSSIDVQYASDAWMRASWLPFVRHAERKPFYFLPNLTKYPLEAVFAWAADGIPQPSHTQYGHMGVSLPIMGLVE